MLTLLVPSGFMVKISKSPVRTVEKAILVPAGLQDGDWSAPASVVSRRTFVPSAFMTKMSSATPSPRVDWNAIFNPSGDHAGLLSAAALLVRRTGAVPS